MQETQLLLVQWQTLGAQIAFQIVAAFGLGLAWLSVAQGAGAMADRQSAFTRVARVARALGLLWLVVLATAWPPLLERTGNVLGPMLLALVLSLLITEAVIYRAAQCTQPAIRQLAGVLVALGYSLALLLVVLAQSWLSEPAGATLVDGRFQVIQWAEVVRTAGFLQGALATALAAVVFAAVWVQRGGALTGAGWSVSVPWPAAWRAVLTALAMACLVGLLWLVSRAAPPSTPFEVALMQGGFDTPESLVVRATFVLWVLTMAGLLVGMIDRLPSSQLLLVLKRAPLVTTPMLWGLGWWQINGRWQQSTLAGLPVADLVSTQPVWVLSVGCLLVAVVVAVAMWSWRGRLRCSEAGAAT